MPIQKFLHKEENADLSNLRKELETLESKPVEKTRVNIVNLRMIVGCGCGGSSTDIHVVVPEGSDFDFSDGDYIDESDAKSLHRRGFEINRGNYFGDSENYDGNRYQSLF